MKTTITHGAPAGLRHTAHILAVLVRPSGRHRATGPAPVRVPLDDLLGRQLAFAEPPVHGVVTHAWRYCPRCRREEPSVLHADGWTCGHCFHTTTCKGDSVSDYDGMTNADVMSADELRERDRDDELRLDAEDDARNTALVQAEEAQAAADVTPGDECGAEFIDGSFTYCGCEECEQREQDDAESER